MTNERGFILVEVLVAFVVASLLLAVLLPMMGKGLVQMRTADGYRRASLWAETKLASIGIVDRLGEGTASGDFNKRYHWRTEIRRVEAGDSSVLLYDVHLRLDWVQDGKSRSIDLSTVRPAVR